MRHTGRHLSGICGIDRRTPTRSRSVIYSSMRPKRRPPRQKPPKNSHCGRGGLHFGRFSGEAILINAMQQPDLYPRPPARPLGITNTQFLHNLACNPPTPHSNLETRTLIFRNFRGCLRTYCEELRATYREAPQRFTRNLRDRWEDANAVVERTPPTACVHSSAQSADHLDKNRRKTAIMAEVVCTLGRLSMRTILINAMHQPNPCPRPSARPLDPTNIQFLHNLACNFPTTHSNL